MIIYEVLKSTKEFKKILETVHDDEDEELREGKSIWKNFLIVKNESLNIVFAKSLWMLIFPAIFYSLTVSSFNFSSKPYPTLASGEI